MFTGGAVYCDGNVESEIVDCNFVGNIAEQDGGAVYYYCANT